MSPQVMTLPLLSRAHSHAALMPVTFPIFSEIALSYNSYMFDFVLAFTITHWDKVSFKMLEGSSIRRLEGAYRCVPLRVTRTYQTAAYTQVCGNVNPREYIFMFPSWRSFVRTDINVNVTLDKR
jgi:hypothetical protein